MGRADNMAWERLSGSRHLILWKERGSCPVTVRGEREQVFRRAREMDGSGGMGTKGKEVGWGTGQSLKVQEQVFMLHSHHSDRILLLFMVVHL